jgi:hypothetical protein
LETVVTDETLEAIKHWQQFSLIQLWSQVDLMMGSVFR